MGGRTIKSAANCLTYQKQDAKISFVEESFFFHGGMAQLVERLVRNEEASGSNPLISTIYGGFPPIKEA